MDIYKEQKKLVSFIAEAIEGLKNGSATCYRFIPETYENGEYAIFIGWSDGYGYDENDKDLIHDKANPSYCITAGVKRRCDALWADFDYLENAPGRLFGSTSISPTGDIEIIAGFLLGELMASAK